MPIKPFADQKSRSLMIFVLFPVNINEVIYSMLLCRTIGGDRLRRADLTRPAEVFGREVGGRDSIRNLITERQNAVALITSILVFLDGPSLERVRNPIWLVPRVRRRR